MRPAEKGPMEKNITDCLWSPQVDMPVDGLIEQAIHALCGFNRTESNIYGR